MRYKRARKMDIRKLWDEEIIKSHYMNIRKRATILTAIILFGFCVIFLRLVDLMVFKHETLIQKAQQQYQKVITLMPQRGTIWDRGMRELAINIETDSLYAVPSDVNDVNTLSKELAPLIRVSASRLISKLSSERKKSFVWLARKIDEETSLKVGSLKNKLKLKEIGLLTETKRYYPKGQLASHILGYTNIDNKGLEGVELRYDKYINGEKKNISIIRDARGVNLSQGSEGGIPGNNLLLTIDEGLQNIIEREIEKAMETWRASAAVAIMMNPMTGEILAMANRPTYDPNSPAEADVHERRNRAVTDFYEPGSTFKVIVAAGVMEEGLSRLDEKFDASKGFINVGGGKPIRDVHRHGVLSFKECVQKSSNVCLVQVGMRLGEKDFYKYMKKFGFGEKTGIDLPGEVNGFLRDPKNWSGRSLASLSIGQEIGVTPLQILRAYSSIANGGNLMRPYIISEIISPSGEIVKRFTPAIERRVISEDTARVMRDILKTVVEVGGTAEKASIKGNLVAGKTGTAQMIDTKTGRYSSHDYVSSFVGFVPADNPRIALIVVIYKPRGATYGGVVAAPVFKNIVEHTLTYLNVPMDTEENYVILVSNPR